MSALNVAELIARKRDGGELRPPDIELVLGAYLSGAVPDYQMSALLMAVFFRGLTPAELERWTAVMIDSGERWDFRGVAGHKVDKHSTGGVGDKVSLVLAPLLAAVELKVPMVAGRGLGHTGGTLDKLEAVPGFRTDLDRRDFERLLDQVGCAIGGQTAAFAPLDRELYALRDVTATVESIPLIAASIVSKKVAEGLDALVLDVKVGAGAFLRDMAAAEELARTMIALAGRFGVRAEAVLTGMDQPLGRAVGNALEVREAVDALRGEGPADLLEITLALAEALIRMVRPADAGDARARCLRALRSGSALERFRRLVAGQGGDSRIVDDPDLLPRAPARAEARAARPGFVQRLDARQVGLLVGGLGGGRARKGEAIDHSVGVVLDRKPGDRVESGERLATVHARTSEAADAAARRLEELYEIGEQPPEDLPLVRKRLAG